MQLPAAHTQPPSKDEPGGEMPVLGPWLDSSHTELLKPPNRSVAFCSQFRAL